MVTQVNRGVFLRVFSHSGSKKISLKIKSRSLDLNRDLLL